MAHLVTLMILTSKAFLLGPLELTVNGKPFFVGLSLQPCCYKYTVFIIILNIMPISLVQIPGEWKEDQLAISGGLC